MTKLRVLSLFAGIGGFDLGLERTGGFETVAVAEINPFGSRVLAERFPNAINVGDVEKAQYPDADFICAGFPCQDISFAGGGAGLAGTRSGLWREVVRAIRVVGPRGTLLENVAALLSRGMGTVLGDLAEVGHDAEWHCIPAGAVGAPHVRDRVWIYSEPQHPDPDSIGSHRADEHFNGNAQPTDKQVGVVGSLGGILANSYGQWKSQSEGVFTDERGWACDCGVKADVSHACGFGRGQMVEREPARASREGPTSSLADANQSRGWGWWEVEPDVGRVADGIPARVDRLKSLGNAVVPQIPELIGRAILASRAGERIAA